MYRGHGISRGSGICVLTHANNGLIVAEARPQLNRLMAEAHQRKFEAIVVWKIDRFGRSPKHLVTALADLGAYGVAFISLRDNLDLSTPSGRLMFHVVAAMARIRA